MSLVVGAGVATLFGCHGLPYGSFAAASMLCVWCTYEPARYVVPMLSIMQPLSHRDRGSLRVAI